MDAISEEYRLPAAVVVCAVISRLHLYRHIRRVLFPCIAALLAYRLINDSNSLLSIVSEAILSRSKTSKFFRFVGDVAGLFLFAFMVKVVSKIMGIRLADTKKSIMDYGYGVAKNIPMVRNELNKEKAKMEIEMDKTMKARSRVPGQLFDKLPKEGVSSNVILDTMKKAVAIEDTRWQEGKVSGSVYLGDSNHTKLLNEAFGLYSLANPLHPDLWPSSMKYESEVIAMTAAMMTTKRLGSVCGSTTSGGTDSIILAIKSHRDYYRTHYGITNPEMICCVTAHAAVDKACELLHITLIKVAANPRTFKVDLGEVERAIGPNTIMMYSSAPTFPQGVIDPIAAMSKLAVKYNIGLHVDCCLGGFILPFAKKLGYAIPEFDFDLPGVTSMSVDTHKYGYALKGTSVVLYSSKELRHAQYFNVPEWTGGMYSTPTIAGSRSTGMIAQTWASMLAMGENGYTKHAKEIMETCKKIADGVSDIEGLEVIGHAEVMIVCFISNNPKMNIYNVAGKMTKKGWSLNSLQNPPCVNICCTGCHVGKEESMLADLRLSVGEVLSAPPGEKEGRAAMYGMASALPNGPVNAIMDTYNDTVYKL